MKKIARFYKVSFEQFAKSACKCFADYSEDFLLALYSNIMMPKRATKGSAGYDFFLPFDLELPPQRSIAIPTGIRVEIEEGWALKIYPRSGLGFNYRLQLDNTVGIIDSDYFFSDNEGHIIIKISNNSLENRHLELSCGKGFAQGIFVEYGITVDDDCQSARNGGFGSTTAL